MNSKNINHMQKYVMSTDGKTKLSKEDTTVLKLGLLLSMPILFILFLSHTKFGFNSILLTTSSRELTYLKYILIRMTCL